MTESADTSEFFQFFEECLGFEGARPSVEGTSDPQLITLANTIMTNPQPFTLVDYGCGKGRFIHTLQSLARYGPDVLSRMHYIGVDANYDYLEECEALAAQTHFASQVRRFELASPGLFDVWTRAADYIFFINTIHEVSVLLLDLILEECFFKLKPGGCLIIHELKQLLSGEKDFITYNEDDIRFLLTDLASPHGPLSCNVFSFESKRNHIPMFNAYVIKTSPKFVSRTEFFLATRLRDTLERKQGQIAKAIAACKEGSIREYAYLIALQANIATSLFWLRTNEAIWHGEPVCCNKCDNDAVDVTVGKHDEELECKIAVVSCAKCGMRHEMAQWDIRREYAKDEDMLRMYYPDEYTRLYRCHPHVHAHEEGPTWREYRAMFGGRV